MKQALLGPRIYSGETFFDKHALLFEAETVVGIVAKDNISLFLLLSSENCHAHNTLEITTQQELSMFSDDVWFLFGSTKHNRRAQCEFSFVCAEFVFRPSSETHQILGSC